MCKHNRIVARYQYVEYGKKVTFDRVHCLQFGVWACVYEVLLIFRSMVFCLCSWSQGKAVLSSPGNSCYAVIATTFQSNSRAFQHFLLCVAFDDCSWLWLDTEAHYALADKDTRPVPRFWVRRPLARVLHCTIESIVCRISTLSGWVPPLLLSGCELKRGREHLGMVHSTARPFWRWLSICLGARASGPIYAVCSRQPLFDVSACQQSKLPIYSSPYSGLGAEEGNTAKRDPQLGPWKLLSSSKNYLLFFHSCGIITIRDLHCAHDVSSINGRTSPCGATQV